MARRIVGGLCERSRPGMSQLDCWNNKQRTPLQDGDHSGNDPRLVPGFYVIVPECSRNRSGECP